MPCKKFVSIAGVLAALAISTQLNAFQKVEVSEAEFLRWPPYCQVSGHTGAVRPKGFIAPFVSQSDQKLMWSVGVWHYCMGLIHVQRAERFSMTDTGKEMVRKGMSDLLYTYKKMPKDHPWFAEMSVTMARAHRVKGESKKAHEMLDLARRVNPSYPMIYTIRAMIHFDAQEYEKAAEALEKGVDSSDGGTPEMNYFLGLAYVHSGKIEKAKEQEALAREGGYPMTGLSRLIARHERN